MTLRRRTALKWTGASLCALIFAAWFAIAWYAAEIVHSGPDRDVHVGVGVGLVHISVSEWGKPGASPGSWRFKHGAWPYGRMSWEWLPHWDHRRPAAPSPFVEETGVAVPLYLPLALIAFPTAWLFYRDRRSVRRRAAGRCVPCGYDLTGNTTGVCPECGAKAQEPSGR